MGSLEEVGITTEFKPGHMSHFGQGKIFSKGESVTGVAITGNKFVELQAYCKEKVMLQYCYLLNAEDFRCLTI
jgi:hypothetical protein